MNLFEPKLSKAIREGDVTDVKDFLQHGLSVNYAFRSSTSSPTLLGQTLMDVAVACGQYGVVKLLAGYKSCDPSLTLIVDVGDQREAVSLKPCLENNRLKRTNLYPCLVKRDVAMVNLLVSAGFDVNLRDERGCTPIWHAVDIDNYQMAKAIASAPNCDVNLHDVTHLYPLHVAAIHGNVKMASLLVRRGASIDVRTVRGSTPLILACKDACYDLVRLLLLNGANPNHCGINGHTSISAVLEKCSDGAILDLLVEAGARIDWADVKKCVKDKLPLLKTCPRVLGTLKTLASTPSSLKMLCCLAIRKTLLSSRPEIHLMYKTQKLPLPNIVKEFLLLNYL